MIFESGKRSKTVDLYNLYAKNPPSNFRRRLYKLSEFETHPMQADFLRRIILGMWDDLKCLPDITLVRIDESAPEYLEIIMIKGVKCNVILV